MNKTFIAIASWLLLLLFAYAAISKLLDYEHFKRMLSKSYYTEHFPVLIAIGLPVVELVVVILLLRKQWRFYGLYGSVMLMVAFTCYIGFLLAFKNHLPCSCGGVLSKLKWKPHLYFNIAFLILAITALIAEKRRLMKES